MITISKVLTILLTLTLGAALSAAPDKKKSAPQDKELYKFEFRFQGPDGKVTRQEFKFKKLPKNFNFSPDFKFNFDWSNLETDFLGLNKKQAAKLSAVKKAYAARLQVLEQKLFSSRLHLRGELAAPKVNMKRVKKLLNKIAKLDAKARFLRIERDQKLKKILPKGGMGVPFLSPFNDLRRRLESEGFRLPKRPI